MLWLRRMALGVVVLFVLIQVLRPSKTNPPVDPKNEMEVTLAIPPEVASIFARSCNDCHSDHTVWPWYSSVAPLSWLIAYDVNHGRRALNFSEWGIGDPKKKAEAIQEICKEMTEKEMPGLTYPILHPAANLTDADIHTVCQWTQKIGQGAAAEMNQTSP